MRTYSHQGGGSTDGDWLDAERIFAAFGSHERGRKRIKKYSAGADFLSVKFTG